MVGTRQILFSLLSSFLPLQSFDFTTHSHEGKSIAIIGAGSAGLAVIKTFLDVPEERRKYLKVVLYEERSDVGGVWLPGPDVVFPPEIPETPLYPRLHTNTPVPSMAYPGFPFPPRTPLFPKHEYVENYHRQYASEFDLLPYIRFKHKVLRAQWVGTSDQGQWSITVRDDRGRSREELFDHLVVASGNNHIPFIPEWEGQEEWLASSPSHGPTREILHSVYYREPERYTNRSVLIIGGGASGRDASSQVVSLAKKTYVSIRHESEIVDGVEIKPDVSHFTPEVVVFKDGSIVDVDAVLLATGYEMRKPFLEEGHVMTPDPSAHTNSSASKGLVTNLRYIFPLHRHILSLCSSYPPNALAFIGLPSAIANCPSDIAQSLFAVHAILDPSILPSRKELLIELASQEQEIRKHGFDPYTIGHRLLNGTSSDYQDDLIDFLKEKKAIPEDGKKYVEQWRRDIFSYVYLKRGWKRIEELGLVEQWLDGVETEAEWAALMQRVNAWQKDWEDANEIRFVRDFDLAG